ncbi:MAG TPA: 23S rRNA (adenine(2503)-C(2))-methyltransferase RlmN [Candidatus Limnocylindrales bacterium]|jgi:23S rRNA (adenine2503-C2)-methyltransferase|nr:23S rRNA (adenine(2503)-C(2))-methyltransferase RlmN [Candidatus Limnocylindrales bacterium]
MAEFPSSGLFGLDFQELSRIVQEHGQPEYRARQLFTAIYPQRLPALEQISTLPQQFRVTLQAAGLDIVHPLIEKSFHSTDGTIRYLMAMADGETVETVWMPEGDEGESGDGSEAGDPISAREQIGQHAPNWERATICVSSQVGCAVNCQFCLTALLGVKRNLTVGEIVGQIVAVLNDRGVDLERQRVNLVFMGMGEPFLNYPNFMKAAQLLVEGVGIPESRMTVSTSGIIPRIYDFGAEPVRPKLAISLNAPNDELRNRVMPLNRKWDLTQLMQAARDFPLRNRERITFEYVLLANVNDAPEHARQVVELVRGIRCKVNLIALNPGPGIHFGTPEEQRVHAFQQILIKAGIPAFVRRPRGRDIYAACGQLKRTVA